MQGAPSWNLPRDPACGGFYALRSRLVLSWFGLLCNGMMDPPSRPQTKRRQRTQSINQSIHKEGPKPAQCRPSHIPSHHTKPTKRGQRVSHFSHDISPPFISIAPISLNPAPHETTQHDDDTKKVLLVVFFFAGWTTMQDRVMEWGGNGTGTAKKTRIHTHTHTPFTDGANRVRETNRVGGEGGCSFILFCFV